MQWRYSSIFYHSHYLDDIQTELRKQAVRLYNIDETLAISTVHSKAPKGLQCVGFNTTSKYCV